MTDSSTNHMDVVRSSRNYVEKTLQSTEGMKALLLDKETISMISLVYSSTELLSHQVVLHDILWKEREPTTYLKAIILVRPTEDNVRYIAKELRAPKFAEYRIFFTNVVRQDHLQRLAEADVQSKVREVQEFYLDFYAVGRYLFHLDIKNSMTVTPNMKQRVCDGIIGVLLGLKMRPNIRYSNGSQVAASLAKKVHATIKDEDRRAGGLGMFHFGNKAKERNPLLLILDRRDDPVTPLLTQWTYQAQVHELLGIWMNRVNLDEVPSVVSKARTTVKDTQVTLSECDDDFFANHMYSNFGDIAVAVQKLLNEYQKKDGKSRNIQSIDDMQRFIENYSDYKQTSNNVTKHVSLIGELARQVDTFKLMDLSQLEQDVPCVSSHDEQHRKLVAKINDPTVDQFAKLRLVMLYALRYENHSSRSNTIIKTLVKSLEMAGLHRDNSCMVMRLLEYGGSKLRNGDLYHNKAAMTRFTRTITSQLRGVENVYTQHKPLLNDILDTALRGRLGESDYPFIGPHTTEAPKDIIVFVVGGVTYEESKCAAQWNVKGKGKYNIVLGGTDVCNSVRFVDNLKHFTDFSSGGRPMSLGTSV